MTRDRRGFRAYYSCENLPHAQSLLCVSCSPVFKLRLLSFVAILPWPNVVRSLFSRTTQALEREPSQRPWCQACAAVAPEGPRGQGAYCFFYARHPFLWLEKCVSLLMWPDEPERAWLLLVTPERELGSYVCVPITKPGRHETARSALHHLSPCLTNTLIYAAHHTAMAHQARNG